MLRMLGAAGPSSIIEPDSSVTRILVVEDDEFMAATLVAMLQSIADTNTACHPGCTSGLLWWRHTGLAGVPATGIAVWGMLASSIACHPPPPRRMALSCPCK